MRALTNKFTNVKNLCQKYEISLTIPRRANCKNHRKHYAIIDLISSNLSMYLMQNICWFKCLKRLKTKYIMPKSSECVTQIHYDTDIFETDISLKLNQQDVDNKNATVPEIMRWKEKRKNRISPFFQQIQLMLWKLATQVFSQMFASCLNQFGNATCNNCYK